MADHSLSFNNFNNQSDSPFDHIRHIDEQGNEFWVTRELVALLDLDILYPELPLWVRDKFAIKSHKYYLDRQDLGFLLLEFSSFLLIQAKYSYLLDASYIYNVAFSYYRGQSATAMFHTVYEKLILEFSHSFLERAYHEYIAENYSSIFKSVFSIEHEVTLNNSLQVDFVLNKRIPVEVKKQSLINQDIKQIKSYMKAMGADVGYIVAPSSDISIPNAIKFFKVTINDIKRNLLKDYVSLSTKLELSILDFTKVDW